MGMDTLTAEKQLSAMQLSAIRDCYSGDSETLESMLVRLELASYPAKSAAILSAMGVGKNDRVFYSGCGEVSVTEREYEQYEALVGTFFSGVWAPESI